VVNLYQSITYDTGDGVKHIDFVFGTPIDFKKASTVRGLRLFTSSQNCLSTRIPIPVFVDNIEIGLAVQIKRGGNEWKVIAKGTEKWWGIVEKQQGGKYARLCKSRK
jgi:hypothetical protein